MTTARTTTRRGLVAAGLLASLIPLAACGGEASEGADGPVEIVGLIEVRGDSEFALDDYDNGAQLAVDMVNSEGGVLGEDLSYERIPASVVDPQQARTAFLKAVDRNPSAIFGFPGGGSLEALTREVDRAGVPMIHISSDGKLAFGAEAGSEWLFSINPDDRGRTDTAVTYAQELGAQTVGIIATDETFGRESTDKTLPALEEAGLDVGAVRYVSPTATDLTSAVLDMQDVDVIISWTFPNILALQLEQMAQNELQLPVITGNSGPLVVANELATGPAIDQLYAATPCAPSIGESAIGQEFAKAYQAEYGVQPTASATQVYDTVRVLARAIEEAGTTDHDAVQEALSDLEMDDGACASLYRTDEAHFLGHQYVVVDFSANGSSKIVETYDVPEAK